MAQTAEGQGAARRRVVAGVLRRGRKASARLLRLSAVAKSVRAVVHIARGLRDEPITLRAAALTYLTVLSLVPLLAVVFSLFQAVVGTAELQANLQSFILRNIAVGSQESVSKTLGQFIQRASSTAIGGVGFVFLVASSVSLMANVEKAFNHTFRAPRERPLAMRFGIYWCFLTLGPILLALSIAGTALLQTSRSFGWLGPLKGVLLTVAPSLVTYTAFLLLYVIVPAVHVKRRAAVLGAFVAGTLWELAKIVYAAVSAHSVRNNAIYGSLSAIPIFLVWTYVSWILVLFGARVAYAAQSSHVVLSPEQTLTPLGRELFVAAVMREVARTFQQGRQAPNTRELAVRLGAGEATVRSALGDLTAGALVRELAGGGWVPARPLNQIPLWQVRQAARGRVRGPDVAGGFGPLLQAWLGADEAAAKRLGTTLDELVHEEAPPAAEEALAPAEPRSV